MLLFQIIGFHLCIHELISGFDYSAIVLIGGVDFLGGTILYWVRDVLREGFTGYHTRVVQKGLRIGFFLFIISEIMLFFGFFWAFFHSALSASIEIGVIYPPVDLEVIPVWEAPLLNTLILVVSGITITWVHKALCNGHIKAMFDGCIITIYLAYFFVSLQIMEYKEAWYNFSDGVYGSCFYMLTGLHGLHVIVGTLAIAFCYYVVMLKGIYCRKHHLSFLFATWYWHFVDLVWIVLFLFVYLWGSW